MSYSEFRNPNSAIPSPVYFPFTFISPWLVEVMSLCFDQVAVYQPAFAEPQEAVKPWVDSGFIDFRRSFEDVIEKKPLQAALRDFANWGLFHQPADMAYLKTAGDITPADPETPRIISDIRGKAPKSSAASEESELSAQLFLHLAQEFDQHAWELREELSRVNHQYMALQGAFRQDQDGADKSIPKVTLPGANEDRGSFMIGKRVAIWNHLFQNDPVDSDVLFTDSHAALSHLLDEVQEKVEVLRFSFTYAQDNTNGLPKSRPMWTDQLRQLFDIVLESPWNATLEERVLRMGREIEEMIDESGGPVTGSEDRRVSFCWYVVPDRRAIWLLNRCCGVKGSFQEDQPAKVKNTIVGLVEGI